MCENFEDKNDLQQEDFLRSFAKQYEGKTEREIWGEIFSLAKEGRKNGTLSNEEIDRYVTTFSSFLNEDQKRKLLKIADRLKQS